MLSRASIKNPYLVLTVIIIVAILGVISYLGMKVDFLPNLNLPYLIVATVSPGLSPLEIEERVTDPVEGAVQSLQKVESVTSNSIEHASIVIIEFKTSANLDTSIIDLRASLDGIKASLPDGTMDSIIMKVNPSMLPVMTFALSERGKTIAESSDYLESVSKSLRDVDGVATVTSNGLIDDLMLVMLSEEDVAEKIRLT